MSSSPKSGGGVSRADFREGPAKSAPSSRFEHSVSMLSWAHNQCDLLEPFLARMTRLLDEAVADWEIVFIDNCSTDRTSLLLRSLAAQEPRLRTFRQMRTVGAGQAYRSALAHAKKGFCFPQTPDAPHDLANLRSILELLKHFDLVTGVHATPQTTLRALASRVAFGTVLRDSSGICFVGTKRARALALKSRTSFIHSEILLRTYQENRKIMELPIRTLDRRSVSDAAVPAVRDAVSCLMAFGTWRRLVNPNASQKRSITRASELDRLNPDIAELIRPVLAALPDAQ